MKIPFLPLGRLLSADREAFHAALDRVLDSGWLVTGPELEAFESEFARLAGTRHCAGVASGLDAIALMFLAADYPRGSEVLVPANSFIASALGVERAGLKAVPVDIDPRTGNVDPDSVRRSCGPDVRALLAVHLHGIPCEMDALRSVCDEKGIDLFEDAAQVHGGRFGGKPCGSFGRAAAFSFYPGKNLGALGDGGAVATSDSSLDDRIRLWRNYGSRTKYVHELPGWNSRLDELQAAFLRARLAHLESDNLARRRCAAKYSERLAGVPELSLPSVPPGAVAVWHLFPILSERRDALRQKLDNAGIGTLVHYPVPLHLQKSLAVPPGMRLPGAEEWCARTLSLPIHPLLEDRDIDFVCEAIGSA